MYYADSNNSKEELKPENVAFVATIRNAKMFSTLDDAVMTLRSQRLDKCIIIDQNGESQIF